MSLLFLLRLWKVLSKWYAVRPSLTVNVAHSFLSALLNIHPLYAGLLDCWAGQASTGLHFDAAADFAGVPKV